MVRWSFGSHKSLAVAGLLAGLLTLTLLVVNRQGPARTELAAQAPILTVIEVQAMPFVLTARGFGVTRPAQTWQAVANVAGRVVQRHAQLRSGTLLPAGTLLLALDPSRYRLAIAAAEADVASLAAEREQLAALLRRLLAPFEES